MHDPRRGLELDGDVVLDEVPAPLPVLARGEREALVERQRSEEVGADGKVAGGREPDAAPAPVE